MHSFRITVREDALEDLRARLRSWRRPAGPAESGGLPRARLEELVRYWLHDFDWRAQAARLNELPQFSADAEGVPLHFIHVRSGRPPLLLLHGWPGSFIEFRHVVALLRDRFDLVVPSLPGYGFSPLTTTGMTSRRIAELMAALMSQLGYERFGVQGGDWGASIGTWLARDVPQRLTGLHLNYIPGSYAPAVTDPTAEERAYLSEADRWVAEDGAYGHLQRTRPLTLGYALSDSPVGLAAWIYEKFVEWADPATMPSLDDILTNVSVYWFTNTISSSMRLYLESVQTPVRFAAGERVTVPTGVLRTRLESPMPPRSWVERVYDVVRWTETERGGHFAALEVPELFAADVAAFFENWR